MPYSTSEKRERSQTLQRALARWENEGGSDDCNVPAAPSGSAALAPQLNNAELVQLQIRMIALENLMVALLADASSEQLERVRNIAASIFPRPGVEHRLTALAAAQMGHLAQRSTRI